MSLDKQKQLKDLVDDDEAACRKDETKHAASLGLF